MNAFITYLIAVLIAAAVIVFIGIVAYNKRLDRIVKGEERGTHTVIPEPKTTAGVTYKTILIIFVVVLLLNTQRMSFMVNNLQTQLRELNHDQDILFSEVTEIRTALEQYAKKIRTADWNITKNESIKDTLDVLMTISLNEYSDDTALVLDLNGEEIAFEKTGRGVYEGRFSVNIFSEYARVNALITEDGKTVIEEVNFPCTFIYEYLPIPGQECTITSDHSFGKWKYSGSYRIVCSRPEEVQSASLTYMSAGRDLKTIDVTDAVINKSSIELEKGLDIVNDLSIRMEIKTKEGYTVICQSLMFFEDNGEHHDQFTRVLDENGHTVWEEIAE